MTTADVRDPARRSPNEARSSADLAALVAACRDAASELAATVGVAQRPRAQKLLKKVTRHAPRVMLVGQTNSGKTALANALVGLPELLPTDVNPSTSAVTALHLNQPWREPPVSFTFFGPADWDALIKGGGRLGEIAQRAGREDEAAELSRQVTALRRRMAERLGSRFEKLMGSRHNFDRVDPALLRRYISVGDDDPDPRSGRFAELVKTAEVAVETEGWPVAVTLIDTPGVNDPFLAREQMTLDALSLADLCVVVLSAHQAMTTIDLALIRVLSGVRSSQLLLFVNRVDELADPARQVPEIAERLGETLRHAGMAEVPPLIFGSAIETAGAKRGLDTLREEVATRLSRDAAVRPLVDAMTDAVGLARQVSTLASTEAPRLGEDAVIARLEETAGECRRALDAAVVNGWREVRLSLSQIIERFVEAEGARYEAALRSRARLTTWSVDTAMLRLTMNERYEAFATTASDAIDTILVRAAEDLSELYRDMIGDGAASVAPPRAPLVPAPVPIARTMTVDADLGWWRRLLGTGVRARINEMCEAVRLEALSLVDELNTSQIPRLSREVHEVSTSLFEAHGQTLLDIASGDPRAKAEASGIPLDRLATVERRLTEILARLNSGGPS